jgi:hypothetical protein
VGRGAQGVDGCAASANAYVAERVERRVPPPRASARAAMSSPLVVATSVVAFSPS